MDLRWLGPPDPPARDLRAPLIALVGAVAESMTTIHERQSDGTVELEVVTGPLPADTAFASYGHTLLLRVRASAAARPTE